MIFCDVETAARIERVECAMLSAACAGITRRVSDVLARPLCGGFASFTEAGSPLNKVAGLGFGERFDEARFLEVEREHARREAPVQVELATLGDPAIAPWLTSHGYVLVGVENVLGCDLASARTAPTADGMLIELASAAEVDTWTNVVVDGFATPDTQGVASHERFERAVLERVIRDFTESTGVQRYLARRAGELAGGAALRIDERIAQLCGSATLPAHRRRGVQTALLARRLDDAARAGCTLAVITTQPGSKSQENAHRRGFELLYSRNILRKERP